VRGGWFVESDTLEIGNNYKISFTASALVRIAKPFDGFVKIATHEFDECTSLAAFARVSDANNEKGV
jgi:hypothetical protein